MAKILIVDDDRKTAEAVGRHLTAAGHVCTLEPNANRVLERAKQERHELLILDVMLPGPSGFELCRRVRSDADLYTLPILIVSAMRGEEEVMHGLAQGADDYLPKPFEPAQLVQRVEALLRVSGSNAVDPVTGMPGIDAIRREIQRRISRRELFGFAYIELLHIRQFGFKCGADSRDKAIRHLARGLEQAATEFAPNAYFLGHMGNGHFVALMGPDQIRKFATAAWKLWLAHREHFYKSVRQEAAYQVALAAGGDQRPSNVPLLDTLCCITVYDRRLDATPQKLFEVLSQIRNKALENKSGGVYVDQRV